MNNHWPEINLSMAVFTVVILLGISSQQLWAQKAPGFAKTFGRPGIDWGEDVQQTSDGGSIIVGTTAPEGSNNYDVYLLKIDAAGNEQWNKTFGGDLYDIGHSVLQTKDGGYLIAGMSSEDVLLLKTDSSGNEMWTKTFGGKEMDWARRVIHSADEGYLVVGATKSFGSGDYDVYLIKTDAIGNAQWEKTIGDKEANTGISAMLGAAGGFCIVGTTNGGETGEKIFLLKVNRSGEKEWEKTFAGKGIAWGEDIHFTTSRGYIITGATSEKSSNSKNDILLIRTDATGEVIWSNSFGGSMNDHAYAVTPTRDGGYVVAGVAAGGDAFIQKTNDSGDEVWVRHFSGNDKDWATSVRQMKNGGFMVTGGTYSYNEGCQVYLIRTDPQGQSPLTLSEPFQK